MRTEDDLRAAFGSLERHAPAAGEILVGTRTGVARRRTRMTGLAVGTAAIAAAAIVGITQLPGGAAAGTAAVPGAKAGSAPVTTLRARLLAAIDTTSGQILHARTTWQDPQRRFTMEGWFSPWAPRPGQQERARDLILNADGTPFQDVEYVYTALAPGAASRAGMPARKKLMPGAVAGIGEIIDVEYGTRTWSDQKNLRMIIGNAWDPVFIRAEITSGHFTVTGRPELDGRPALELTFRGTDHGTVISTDRLWVDAQTYLPFREYLSYLAGDPGHTYTASVTSDFELLPPTSVNLAQLRPVIPAGFRRTATQELPRNGTGVG